MLFLKKNVPVEVRMERFRVNYKLRHQPGRMNRLRLVSWYVRTIEKLNRKLGFASMYLMLLVLGVLMFPVLVRGCETLYKAGGPSFLGTIGSISTIWTLETAQFAVGAYYILGAGFSLLQGAHVRMDFLYANWRPRTKALVDSFTALFVLFYLVVMILGAWDSSTYAVVSKQINHTVWAPYMAPIKIAMLIGMVFMLLQVTAEMAKDIARVFGYHIISHRERVAAEEYNSFAGRARRREYWMHLLISSLLGLAVGPALVAFGFPAARSGSGIGLFALSLGASLILIAPLSMVPVTVRRLHDLDMSGWWTAFFLLLCAVPGLGLFAAVAYPALLAQDGTPGENNYGLDPKGRDEIEVFDPRPKAEQAPLPEIPLPAATAAALAAGEEVDDSDEPDPVSWTPPLVFAGVCLGLLLGGLALGAMLHNPTWFMLGAGVFLISVAVLARTAIVAMMNRKNAISR